MTSAPSPSNLTWWRAPGKTELTMAYYETLSEVFKKSEKLLFNTNIDNMCSRAPFVFAEMNSKGAVVSGLQVSVDGAGTGHIDNLVTLPSETKKGKATALLLNTCDVLRTRFHLPRARVAIPQYHTESDHLVRTFSRVGFIKQSEFLMKVSNSATDRHLSNYAMPNGCIVMQIMWMVWKNV